MNEIVIKNFFLVICFYCGTVLTNFKSAVPLTEQDTHLADCKFL